jgi:2-dehydro-3-deoxygluconokinase
MIFANMFGNDSIFVTKIPMCRIRKSVTNALHEFGINTSLIYILRIRNRLGVSYCEKGASQQGRKVIYDRKNPSEFV